jgi:hypothetical protein
MGEAVQSVSPHAEHSTPQRDTTTLITLPIRLHCLPYIADDHELKKEVQLPKHSFVLLSQRISDYFVQETGSMSLSYEGKLWKQCEHLSAGSWPGVTTAVSLVSEMVRPGGECQDSVLIFRAQSLASSARIRGNDRAIYSELLDKLLDSTSWMYATEVLRSPWTASREVSLGTLLSDSGALSCAARMTGLHSGVRVCLDRMRARCGLVRRCLSKTFNAWIVRFCMIR